MMRKAVMFLIGMALVVSTVYAEPTARVTGGTSVCHSINLGANICKGGNWNVLVWCFI
jgi:hypothetical protein